MPGTLLVAAMIAASTLAACHDLPTAPRGQPFEIARSNDFTSDPQWGRNSSPSSGSWDGEVSAWNGSTPFGPGWNFPYKTIIIVSISGEVRQADGALPGTGAVWPPTGLTNINGTHGAIGYVLASASGSAMAWPAKTTDTVVVRHQMRPLRGAVDGAQLQYYTEPYRCGVFNNQTPRWACFTYLGAAHLQFSRPSVQLTLTKSGAAVVRADSLVTFTAGMSVTTIGGRPVDMSDLRWRWVPSVSVPADTLGCDAYSGTTCSKRIETSGMMYVTAYVNGEAQQQAIQVDIDLRCQDRPDMVRDFPELANPVMDTALKHLWKDSKYSPDSRDTSRREIGGWIIRNDDGTYRFERFVYNSVVKNAPCWTNSPLPVPANAVMTVHTHPFKTGDSYAACGENLERFKNRDGSWGQYQSAASGRGYPRPSGDFGELEWINRNQTSPNGSPIDLKGAIFDADGIITYDRTDLIGGSKPGVPRVPGHPHLRCSY